MANVEFETSFRRIMEKEKLSIGWFVCEVGICEGVQCVHVLYDCGGFRHIGNRCSRAKVYQ